MEFHQPVPSISQFNADHACILLTSLAEGWRASCKVNGIFMLQAPDDTYIYICMHDMTTVAML